VTGRANMIEVFRMLLTCRTAVLVPTMFILLAVTVAAQVESPAAPAAQPAGPPASSFAPASSYAFDVVSIKPSDPNARGPVGGFAATGLRAIDFPLSEVVFMAYFPLNSQKNQIIGMPAWAYKEGYDFVAHIDETSAAAWLKLAPLQRQQPGRPMLQKLLADRCKLVAHTVPTQIAGYVLVVSKGGPRLSPSKPGEIYPSDAKDGPDGSKVVIADSADNSQREKYFNATLGLLTERLSWAWDIEDQTNLTGKYDFTIRRLQIPVDADGKRIADPQPSDLWDLSGTGLELRRAKLPSQNLVIDHIERPSPN
jgi:uncharacterized protein (TIGR03435 family)